MVMGRELDRLVSVRNQTVVFGMEKDWRGGERKVKGKRGTRREEEEKEEWESSRGRGQK
jgi:hypothetical protein